MAKTTGQVAQFPSQAVSDSEKKSSEYGLKVARAIEQDWFNKDRGNGRYFQARDEYHRNRPKGMQFGAPLPPEQVQHFRDQIGYTGLADWQK